MRGAARCGAELTTASAIEAERLQFSMMYIVALLLEYENTALVPLLSFLFKNSATIAVGSRGLVPDTFRGSRRR